MARLLLLRGRLSSLASGVHDHETWPHDLHGSEAAVLPPAGEAHFLVVSSTADGRPGSAGRDSGGAERPSP